MTFPSEWEKMFQTTNQIAIGSMVLVYLPLFTYKTSDFVRANVGKYSIHGAYGIGSGCFHRNTVGIQKGVKYDMVHRKMVGIVQNEFANEDMPNGCYGECEFRARQVGSLIA